MATRRERRAIEARRPSARDGVLALQRVLLSAGPSEVVPETVTGPVAFRFGDGPDDVVSMMILGGPCGGMIEAKTHEAMERALASFAAGPRPACR
jgi:hypothetical protein